MSVRDEEPRAQLRRLLQQNAVLRGDFVLSSGQRSSFYLDARRVTLSAVGSPLVGQAFLDVLPLTEIDAVAGLTVGADPIVASVVTIAGERSCSLDGLIVRKERKQHGAGRRIEGPWRAGMRVAVVDDTLTTGASSLEAVNAVLEAGGEVEGVFALIDREQGAREAIESAGYALHALFTAGELLGE